MSVLLGKGMLGGLSTEQQIAALLAGANSWAGLQTFGGGFTINGLSLWGPTATFTYLGTAAAAHRTALQVPGSVTTGVTGADAISNIISLTQAEYDAIVTKNASTLYVIL